MTAVAQSYDAVVVISYGGPEGPDDVLPFLENATRGRGVPRERLLEVAEHYHHFGGVSPINEQNRALVAALQRELDAHGPPLRVYLGNRNWHPFIEDAVRDMRNQGVSRALALVTSAYSSYSGCRQYREDIAAARTAVGEGAPVIDKLRTFHNHPGFIEANADSLRCALEELPASDRDEAHVVFTAHSIPLSMSACCAYQTQLEETAALVAAAAGVDRHSLSYQSRSGPLHVPWLGPDITDHLTDLAPKGTRAVVVHPIGFVSDHMEVMYDLDHEARHRALDRGLHFQRAATVGTRAPFLRCVRSLILERIEAAPRLALGALGPGHDDCPPDCCLIRPA